jgi:serine protease Do
MRFLSFLFIILILSGCSIVDVPKVEDAPYTAVTEDARPSPFGLRKIKINTERGEVLGSVSPRYPFICHPPWGELFDREVTNSIEGGEFKRSFNQAMEAQGYDITGSNSIMFDEEDDEARTLYTIGAKITDIKVDLCNKSGFGFGFMARGYTGEAYIQVEWSIYDRLRRKTTYKTISEGYGRLKMQNPEGAGLLLDSAFGAAAHNLGAQKEFHDLIVYGKQPANSNVDEAAAPMDSDEDISIARLPISTTPLTATMEDSRKAAVLVQSGAGHGSGFFISEAGHILTNHHVVGNAEKVRIETAGKKKKILATVIRRDKIRDVAILQLDEIPENLKIQAQPLRLDWPKVGEDVYAIGAPLHQKSLQDTVTKGIISAHRKNYKVWGTYMDLLQADVSIHGGNSGGPLLDANGNIVGLSVAGINNSSGDSVGGLNFFVPIAVALDRLDIEY